MDKLIGTYNAYLSDKIEALAELNQLPDNLDIYDVSELYTSDNNAQLTIRTILFDAYKNGLLPATKGLRPNKIISSLGRKTEKRGGVLVVLYNEHEISFHKNDLKKWLLKENQWPLENCLLVNWWSNTAIEAGHGFTVCNNKITPALYEKLIEHTLIKNEGLEKFKEAFERNNGVITWLGDGTHGYGVKSVIYLIAKIKLNGIISNKNFIKITSLVFQDVNQNSFNHGSLTSSKSSIKDAPPNESKIIDRITEELTNYL